MVDPAVEPVGDTMICFIDTEATGVGPDDEIWEFAARRRNDDGTSEDLHFFIVHNEDKAQQLPVSFYQDWLARWPGHPVAALDTKNCLSKGEASRRIQRFTLGATIVGVNPGFDIEKLSVMMRRNGFEPKWHYFPVDVTSMVAGFLAGYKTGSHEADAEMPTTPWHSDKLSRAIGVEPNDYDRHTAMGDCLWCEAQWDRMMG